MNPQQIMDLYNQHERVDLTLSGYDKVASKEVVKFVSQDKYGSFVSYFNFSEQDAQQVIDQEVAYFKARDLNFEWKTYDTDHPENIAQVLIEKGFVADEPESFMVLDVVSAHLDSKRDELCTEVSDYEGIRDAIKVQEQVWGGDFSGKLAHLVAMKTKTPDQITIYVVYEQGEPVSSAWIIYNHSSPFAGIWGGSTLSSHRGQGHYTALLNKRICDAKARGIKYLTIDASDMSRPIVAKHGFEFITKTTPYLFDAH
ncbi:GNAT family N-acetyltransferase [Vibrio sp. SCSIO 43136]|uniref:GNAT family N-acetyltransferase n=1 Tax=Vibrio sp. SCSIO 43136 TaxID=2819101 RepID=UPI0020756709|nr:GNAT family N-acetyltransferase [Vibrio sp. SCSIO 43136]USD67570.1 GNAT family N-acetyltransferase [Vibrio sp. SCSIO 43136]